jgi:hypothetical protein
MPVQASPVITPPNFVKRQWVQYMNPLFACTAQTTEVEQSKWIQVPGGSYLQLTLAITALIGTLSVIVETCNSVNPTTNTNNDAPRFLGAFKQTPGATLPSSVQMTSERVSDNFIRITAVPGQGADQTATYTVSGQAVLQALGTATSG